MNNLTAIDIDQGAGRITLRFEQDFASYNEDNTPASMKSLALGILSSHTAEPGMHAGNGPYKITDLTLGSNSISYTCRRLADDFYHALVNTPGLITQNAAASSGSGAVPLTTGSEDSGSGDMGSTAHPASTVAAGTPMAAGMEQANSFAGLVTLGGILLTLKTAVQGTRIETMMHAEQLANPALFRYTWSAVYLPLGVLLDCAGGESVPQAITSQVAGVAAQLAVAACMGTGLLPIATGLFAYYASDKLVDYIWDRFGRARVRRRVSPLILDLDGDGVETLGKKAGVFFDHDANGFAQLSGWVAPDDGLLVWDRNGNGQIDDGSELFGNNTLLENGRKAANGFAALAELDENGDKVLDASDAAFAALRVWRDMNSDGKVGEGELLSLDALGIQSLGTSYTTQNLTDANGNRHAQLGSFTFIDSAGQVQTQNMTDVWFSEDTARALPTDLVEVSKEIAALPDVMAFGNVYGLHQAMARDASGALRALVEQFGAEADPEKRAAIMEQLIYTWAGAAGVVPDSRGPYIDARKVATLEAFMGEAFRQGSSANPSQQAPALLEQAFAALARHIEYRLMVQTHLAPVLAGIRLTINQETGQFGFDVSQGLSLVRESYAANAGNGAALLDALVHFLQDCGVVGEPVLKALRAEGSMAGDEFSFALATAGLHVLKGTEAHESFAGTAGDDIYVIGANGGQDSIQLSDGQDTLRFGAGIGLEDLRLEKRDRKTGKRSVSSDLVLRIGEGGQRVTLLNWYAAGEDRRVDRFTFADGTTLSWQELLERKAVSATSGTLVGNRELKGERLVVGAGATQVTLQAMGGDTVLDASQAAGQATLRGAEGQDLLIGSLAPNATVSMAGGMGSDEYLIRPGGGQTMIASDGDTESTDTLRFGEGITLDDLRLEKSSSDLVLRIGEGGQTVKLLNWYAVSADKRIDRFAFADGKSLSWQELLAQKAVSATSGTLVGNRELKGERLVVGAGATQVTLQAMGGDTVLDASQAAGQATLRGAEGQDLLIGSLAPNATVSMAGGMGSDEYLIRPGGGETVIALDGDTESADTLRFGEGITLEDLRLEKRDRKTGKRSVSSDLVLRIGEGGQRVTLLNWYAVSADKRIDRFAFADGTTLSWQELLAQKAVSAANGGYLQGNEGLGDILSGGSKSTVLTGGSGADVFLFRDALDETNNVDRITDFKPGEDKLHLSRSVFTALSEAGPLADSLFVANATGSALDDRDCILYNTTTGALLYDPDGTGAGAAIQFARLDSRPELKASDFFVVK